MKRFEPAARALFSILVLGLTARYAAADAVPQGRDVPDSVPAGRRIRIESKILGETREVWIHLPAGYDDGPDRYPLLLQLGGEPHFLYAAAVADVLSRGDHIPGLIVAAVLDPTLRHHYRDSTPTRVDYLPAGGGADLFLRFLKEELVPDLEARFRTQPFRILCGHGLSGLFAVHALLESPGTFGAFITDGASLAYDDSALLKRAGARLADPGAGVRGALYLGVGNETETRPGIAALSALLGKTAPPGLEWKTETFDDEDQATASLPACYHGLKWVFRGWRIPVETAVEGMDAVKAYFRGLSGRFGYEIPVTEKTLSARGFQLVREQRFEEAETLLRLNASAYPDSPNVYHGLAVLGERRRRWDEAAAWYEEAARKAGPSRPELAGFFRRQAELAKSRTAKSGTR